MSTSTRVNIMLRIPFISYIVRLVASRNYLELLLLTMNTVFGVTLLALWTASFGVLSVLAINVALVSAWLLFTLLASGPQQ